MGWGKPGSSSRNFELGSLFLKDSQALGGVPSLHSPEAPQSLLTVTQGTPLFTGSLFTKHLPLAASSTCIFLPLISSVCQTQAQAIPVLATQHSLRPRDLKQSCQTRQLPSPAPPTLHAQQTWDTCWANFVLLSIFLTELALRSVCMCLYTCTCRKRSEGNLGYWCPSVCHCIHQVSWPANFWGLSSPFPNHPSHRRITDVDYRPS